MRKILLIVVLSMAAQVSVAADFSGKFSLGGAVLSHDVTSCDVPCGADLPNSSSTAVMELGFLYDLGLFEVGVNTLFIDGLGYAVEIRKGLNKYSASFGVGQIETDAKADFGTFNPFNHSADAMGNMGYIDLAYKIDSDMAIFIKYLYTTADHSETANEFLGFDVDGNKIFGSNTQRVKFDSESQSLGVGIRWLF